MIILTAILSVLWIATVVAGVWKINEIFQTTLAEVAKYRDSAVAEREAWSIERSLLLERIQRPEYRPVAPSEQIDETPNFSVSDELYLVGTIQDGQTPPPDEAA